MNRILHFTGFIKNVRYKACLIDGDISVYNLDTYDVNKCKSYGFIQSSDTQLAYSKWVSPKRTRSYPFSRIYNTYNAPKISTIIPIIKDEGRDGDLDKIQYSTVTWMNLLNIYIVLGYYSEAEKSNKPKQIHKNKLTNQKFHWETIQSQINEIITYKQSALHWNIHLFEEKFTSIFQSALDSYENISSKTNVAIHSQKSLKSYRQKILSDFNEFRDISLKGSQRASHRESKTLHAQEFLHDGEKATVCIKNYLGGEYHLTADEVLQDANIYIIQESKNSNRNALPDLTDIQDGLFKLIRRDSGRRVDVERKGCRLRKW